MSTRTQSQGLAQIRAASLVQEALRVKPKPPREVDWGLQRRLQPLDVQRVWVPSRRGQARRVRLALARTCEGAGLVGGTSTFLDVSARVGLDAGPAARYRAVAETSAERALSAPLAATALTR